MRPTPWMIGVALLGVVACDVPAPTQEFSSAKEDVTPLTPTPQLVEYGPALPPAEVDRATDPREATFDRDASQLEEAVRIALDFGSATEEGTEAFRELCVLGLQRAVPHLIRALREERDTERALELLGLIGEPAAAAIPEVLRLLREDDGYRSQQAAETLVLLDAREPEVLRELVRCVLANPYRDRERCTSAVERLAAGLEPPRELLLGLEAEDERVRILAMNLLADFGASARETLPALLDRCREVEGEERRAAALALGALGNEGLHAVLALTTDPDEATVLLGLSLLETLAGSLPRGPDPALDALRAALDDPRGAVCARAIDGLRNTWRHWRRREAMALRERFLQHPDPKVRELAGRALLSSPNLGYGLLAAPVGVPAERVLQVHTLARELYSADPSQEELERTAASLLRLRSDADWLVRLEAAWGLARCGASSADSLRQFLEDEEELVRRMAARGLQEAARGAPRDGVAPGREDPLAAWAPRSDEGFGGSSAEAWVTALGREDLEPLARMAAEKQAALPEDPLEEDLPPDEEWSEADLPPDEEWSEADLPPDEEWSEADLPPDEDAPPLDDGGDLLAVYARRAELLAHEGLLERVLELLDVDALPALREQLASDPARAEALLAALGTLERRASPAAPELIQVLRTHPEAKPRRRAARLLGRLGGHEGVEALLALRDDADVRPAVLEALSAAGTLEAVAGLSHELDEAGSAEDARSLAEQIGAAGEHGLPVLTERAEAGGPLQRVAAVWGLLTLLQAHPTLDPWRPIRRALQDPAFGAGDRAAWIRELGGSYRDAERAAAALIPVFLAGPPLDGEARRALRQLGEGALTALRAAQTSAALGPEARERLDALLAEIEVWLRGPDCAGTGPPQERRFADRDALWQRWLGDR